MSISKPLGRKAYGSIGHLPTSRLGPGDHKVTDGQARICLEKARDRHDTIIVQEKLDGSCCSVAKLGGQIMPLTRSGYAATTSKYEQHHFFADFVRRNAIWFDDLLEEGERVVGEWLAQAHGTRYALPHMPFVAFDIMREATRTPCADFSRRVNAVGLVAPRLLSFGPPVPLEKAVAWLNPTFHGALDPIEGVVYRVERKGVVDYLAKWVRPDKVDGCYLPSVTGGAEVWNWKPAKAVHAVRGPAA